MAKEQGAEQGRRTLPRSAPEDEFQHFALEEEDDNRLLSNVQGHHRRAGPHGDLLRDLPDDRAGHHRGEEEAQGLRHPAGAVQAATAEAGTADSEAEGEEGPDPGSDSRRAGTDPDS